MASVPEAYDCDRIQALERVHKMVDFAEHVSQEDFVEQCIPATLRVRPCRTAVNAARRDRHRGEGRNHGLLLGHFSPRPDGVAGTFGLKDSRSRSLALGIAPSYAG